jgi:hypothetical protein
LARRPRAGRQNISNENSEELEMDTEDGWPQVWAEMSDEELGGRLQDYLWLAAKTPNAHADRLDQLQHQAVYRGRPERVDAARSW